jgi:hypothetical protein
MLQAQQDLRATQLKLRTEIIIASKANHKVAPQPPLVTAS